MAETTATSRRNKQRESVNVIAENNEPKVTPVPVVHQIPEVNVKTRGVIAVDNGGFKTKVLSDTMDKPIWIYSQSGFGSDLGSWASQIADDGQTYMIKIDEEIFFTGLLLRQAHDELNGYIDNKDDDFFVVLILLSCALYGYDVNYLVNCVPISQYQKYDHLIKERLIGHHSIEINNLIYEFEIADVAIVKETLTACAYDKPEGLTRWLDIASRTVGFASTIFTNGVPMPIKAESGTIEKAGLAMKKVVSWKAYATSILKVLTPIWNKEDRVVVFGGGALEPELIKHLQAHFPNLEVADDPVFLQVKGMLETGLDIFADQFEDDDIND